MVQWLPIGQAAGGRCSEHMRQMACNEMASWPNSFRSKPAWRSRWCARPMPASRPPAAEAQQDAEPAATAAPVSVPAPGARTEEEKHQRPVRAARRAMTRRSHRWTDLEHRIMLPDSQPGCALSLYPVGYCDALLDASLAPMIPPFDPCTPAFKRDGVSRVAATASRRSTRTAQ